VSADAVADYVRQSLKALNILLQITVKVEIGDLHCGLMGYGTVYSHYTALIPEQIVELRCTEQLGSCLRKFETKRTSRKDTEFGMEEIV
jgi:hypothetical protein